MTLEPIFNAKARKPSPKPVDVNLRSFFLIGIFMWIIAGGVAIFSYIQGWSSAKPIYVCAIAIIIGILMLIWEYIDRDNYRKIAK